MKRLISVVFLLIQILFELHAQSYEELGDIFVHSAYTLARNQVKYTSPSNFVLETMETEYLECLRSKYYTRQLPFAPFFDNKFISKDENCIVFIDVVPVASKDSKFIDFPYLQKLKLDINTYHISRIMYDFKFNTGKNNISWRELPLRYESSKYANMAFNADGRNIRKNTVIVMLSLYKKMEDVPFVCIFCIIIKLKRT